MKLKNKLIISFLIIILVPLALTVMAFIGLGTYQLSSMEKRFGIEDTDYESFSNPTAILSKMTRSIYQSMQNQAAQDVGAFEDTAYLDVINVELESRYSYLLVRKGEDFIYKGTKEEIDPLVQRLPDYGEYANTQDVGVFMGGEVQTLVKKLDLVFLDGSEGSAFIVTSVRGMIPQVKSLLIDMGLAIISILIFTSALLTVWIYKSIVTPIHHLEIATQNIKEGNLDFEMQVEGKDEIGQLCRDFEEMRRRLKESTEEKVRVDQQNKELISNISHDLKTPITAVKGYVEGLMDGVADTPEKQEKYIRTIYNKANDMDRLINELTFYSKIDTNRIPYTFDKINVRDYFADCVEEIGLELEQSRIRLGYFNYVEEDVLVIADAEQIKRVINNIIGNSSKYMDKVNGAINIGIRDVGDFIQVEIEDNGRGIDARDLPYIFDRFYRTDASRNSSKGGSGIGLSIVKKIVEDHGGKIWATSRPGTGTVMHFVLRKYQEVFHS